TLEGAARRYLKPIIVAETAYPWRAEKHGPRQAAAMIWPMTPQGQRAFLDALVAVVRQTPEGLGRGVLWWEPEWIAVPGLGGGWGSRALFDAAGEALPAVDALHAAAAGLPA